MRVTIAELTPAGADRGECSMQANLVLAAELQLRNNFEKTIGILYEQGLRRTRKKKGFILYGKRFCLVRGTRLLVPIVVAVEETEQQSTAWIFRMLAGLLSGLVVLVYIYL